MRQACSRAQVSSQAFPAAHRAALFRVVPPELLKRLAVEWPRDRQSSGSHRAKNKPSPPASSARSVSRFHGQWSPLSQSSHPGTPHPRRKAGPRRRSAATSRPPTTGHFPTVGKQDARGAYRIMPARRSILKPNEPACSVTAVNEWSHSYAITALLLQEHFFRALHETSACSRSVRESCSQTTRHEANLHA